MMSSDVELYCELRYIVVVQLSSVVSPGQDDLQGHSRSLLVIICH